MDWPFGDQVLVEPYIPGRELTVGVMGDRPLAVTELRPRRKVFTTTRQNTLKAAPNTWCRRRCRPPCTKRRCKAP